MSQNSVNPSLENPEAPVRLVKVWDLPVRLFHWSLAALVITAVATGLIGGNAMDNHLLAGYGVTVLVAFRLMWGCVGSPYARFTHFVRGVPSILNYCRELFQGSGPQKPGHNPLGGWMVVILLLTLAFQVGTGLVANDDILTEGPLFHLVSKETSDYLTGFHKLGFKVLAGLAGLHILAIGFYAVVKRTNLVKPMITGRMEVSDPTVPEHAVGVLTNLFGIALLAAAAASFYFLVL